MNPDIFWKSYSVKSCMFNNNSVESMHDRFNESNATNWTKDKMIQESSKGSNDHMIKPQISNLVKILQKSRPMEYSKESFAK